MLSADLKGGAMYHWMDGWGWFWMSFMMVFWIVVLGAVVYAAVRLANRVPTDPKGRS
jgi:heme/copper-type cytochrome/quinol oxidase subunit 2